MTEHEQPSEPFPVAAPAPPAGTPPGTPARKPHGKQLLILLLGGGVLAFGGCALFLGTLNFNSSDTSVLNVVFAICFVVGAVMFAIGCILALVLIVTALFRTESR
jgi:hypothetical protein